MAKVGRPTKYNPIYVKEVENYLKETGHGSMHMPKIESFAIRIGVSKNTLYEWAKLNEDFQDALERIRLFQCERLIDDGIYGGKEVNSTIVKLMLQNNHGMKERVDQTTNDKELPAPTFQVLTPIAKTELEKLYMGDNARPDSGDSQSSK